MTGADAGDIYTLELSQGKNKIITVSSLWHSKLDFCILQVRPPASNELKAVQLCSSLKPYGSSMKYIVEQELCSVYMFSCSV